MKYIIVYIVAVIVIITLSILFYKWIGESDLPLWLKFFLLK